MVPPLEGTPASSPSTQPQESTGSAGGSAPHSPRHTEEESAEEASVAAPSPSPPSPRSGGGHDSGDDAALADAAEQGLGQLRALGRQLLQGWAEALGALVKLPGVGSMRVDALAARLSALAREASPAAAAAAAAQAAAEGGAAGPASSAVSEGGGGLSAVTSRGGTPPLQAAPPAGPLPNELAGPNSRQAQAYSDPVDMFATAAKSAHLSYPELLHAFAASAEGAGKGGPAGRRV